MPTVSVIIPIYNAEALLQRCVDSIIAQSYTDFELILIDDGSTDGSGVICDQFEKQDHRVKVIHQENHGAASARNTGIDAAHGVFLAFCDSDDMVSDNWLSRMLDLTGDTILAVGAYCTQNSELGRQKDLGFGAGVIYNKGDYYFFNREGIAGFLWNALYRKDIVNKLCIRFREDKTHGDYNEDLLFTMAYIQGIDGIVYTGYTDYLYNARAESLSRRGCHYYYEKYAEKYRIWDSFILMYQPKKPELRKELATRMISHFIVGLRETNDIKDLRQILHSSDLEKCLSLADTSKENSFEVKLLQSKKTVLLFLFYKMLRMKESLCK